MVELQSKHVCFEILTTGGNDLAQTSTAEQFCRSVRSGLLSESAPNCPVVDPNTTNMSLVSNNNASDNFQRQDETFSGSAPFAH